MPWIGAQFSDGLRQKCWSWPVGHDFLQDFRHHITGVLLQHLTTSRFNKQKHHEWAEWALEAMYKAMYPGQEIRKLNKLFDMAP